MSREDGPLKLGFAALIGGGILLYSALKNFRKARQIEDVARIDIASAPMGLVELEGYAWPAERSIASVSGRDVVYYNYRVEEYVTRDKNSTWETRYEYDFNEPFYVIDASGVCLVYPRKECMDVTEQISKLTSYSTDILSLRASITSSSIFGFGFGRSYRLVENKIFVGSPVYVCGDLRGLSNSGMKIKGDFKKFLSLTKAIETNPVFKMQKFDLNHDGKVSDLEILAGLSDASRQVLSGPEMDIKVAGAVANSENHTLIVADCHQSELLQRVSSFNNLKLVGGIALIGLGVYVLTHLNQL